MNSSLSCHKCKFLNTDSALGFSLRTKFTSRMNDMQSKSLLRSSSLSIEVDAGDVNKNRCNLVVITYTMSKLWLS